MNDTQHQKPRGTRPDGKTEDAFYLVKRVVSLEATYQVRLLTYFAVRDSKTLVIVAPTNFSPAPSLKALMERTGSTIRIERGER